VIWWLTTFALLADELKWWNFEQRSINAAKDYEDKYSFDYGGSYDDEQSAVSASKAATGLSAVNWLLFCVTLVAFSYFLHGHRKANGATGFAGLTLARNKPTADVESAQQEKVVVHEPVELRDVPQYPAAAH